MFTLPWPTEAAVDRSHTTRKFSAPGSNLVLDFHGDPATAELAVFSDGNHHMALEAAIRAFVQECDGLRDVFYTTTPPAPLVDALKGDGLVLGNLCIGRKPDVFISPENILDSLVDDGFVARHAAFAESRGNVILVRRGNPKSIQAIGDLLSDEVCITCSNPQSEKASFVVYRETAEKLSLSSGVDAEALVAKLSIAGERTVHSQVIHHREVPTLIASGQADAAIIYYHLALRYTRIFPQEFEIVDISGVSDSPHQPGNPTTRYHVGVVGDGGRRGHDFVAFLNGPTAQGLYAEHGLLSLH
ncbi:MAG: substrate-binding domain-containing protein [Pseudomonadota bacterium]